MIRVVPTQTTGTVRVTSAGNVSSITASAPDNKGLVQSTTNEAYYYYSLAKQSSDEARQYYELMKDCQEQADWEETDINEKSYIKNKPTIPVVGNGVITINQNGIQKGSFNLNQSENTSVNLDCGISSVAWGDIGGTLSNQTDLQTILNAKQALLTFDSKPTSGSLNPVTSNGIYTEFELKQNSLTSENAGTDISIVTNTGGNEILSGNTALTLVNAKADGLNYLKLFGGCEQRNLPADYTQLDWIEGDDGMYIDTGITPSCDVLRVKWKGQLVGSSYSGSFIGCVAGSSPRAGFRIFSNANTAELNFQSYSSLVNPGFQATGINTVDVTYDNINKTITGYCNSTIINETNANINTNFGKNMLLFGAYIGDTLGAALPSKCWGLLVEKDGVTVLNYIPAKRNSDNKLGMYDTVTGTFFTNAGTGDFVAGSAVTPSPDTPLDIVCNNGVLKVRKLDSGLPEGYTKVKYITFTGAQYINTGIYGDKDTEITTEFYINSNLSSSVYLYGCQSSGNTATFTAYLYSSVYWRMADKTVLYNEITRGEWHTSVQSSAGVNLDGTLTPYAEMGSFTTPYTILLGTSRNTSGGIASNVYFVGNIASWKVSKNNTLLANYIPCINSSNVYGFYDTVSQTFKPSASSTAFSGGEVKNDYEIYADGTVETVEDELGNTATAEILLETGSYKDVQEVLTGDITRNVDILVLDGTEDWTKTLSYENAFRADNIVDSANGLLGFSTHFVRCANTSEIGNSGTFTPASNDGRLILGIPSTIATNTSGLKTWLAQQYQDGTPVIIVYPLATAKTETVTGQTLTTKRGTNVIEITQASIDNLPLEVSFKKPNGVIISFTNESGYVKNSTLSNYVLSSSLSTVATSGDYDDLVNKPSIPNSQIQSDWAQTDTTSLDYIKNKPSIPSGSIVDQTFDGTSSNAQSGAAIQGKLAYYTLSSSLSTVATSGSYNDLTNKPNLNGKADTNLSNLTVGLTNTICTTPATTTSTASGAIPAVIIENYVSGTSWYRVYSDGWCEQGGVVPTSTASVSLLKSYVNTNYSILMQYVNLSNSASAMYPHYCAPYKYVDHFTIVSSSIGGRQWYACGYIR